MNRDKSPTRNTSCILPSFVLKERSKGKESEYHKVITEHSQKKSGFHTLFAAMVKQKRKVMADSKYYEFFRPEKQVWEYEIRTPTNRVHAFPSVRNSAGSNDICRYCGEWCAPRFTTNKYEKYYCLIGQYRVDIPERERANEEDPMAVGISSYPYPFLCKQCFDGIYLPQVNTYSTWVLGKLFDIEKILVVNHEWTPQFVKGLTPRRLEIAKNPPKNPRDPMSIHRRFFYAAGKISGTYWRDTREMHVEPENMRTYQHHRYKGTDLVYIGPYPIGCDHKCWHSTPHAAANDFGANCGDVGVELGLSDVLENSQSQIRICEIFYARIEETDCFGTFSEIGYASAFGKAIYIDMDPNLKTATDMWFLAEQSLQSSICDNDIRRIPLWKHFKPDFESEIPLVEQYKSYLRHLTKPPNVFDEAASHDNTETLINEYASEPLKT